MASFLPLPLSPSQLLALSFLFMAPIGNALNTTLSLGQPCNPSSSLCSQGVSCYAVNSMQIPTCGSFQATCTGTSQCATNTCVDGFCSGPLLPSLGTQCTPTFEDPVALPCAFGADCYAVNSMLITQCGNFQSSCSWDGMCAFNSCVGGFCAGQLFSSSASMLPSPTSSGLVASTPLSSHTSSYSKYYPANATSFAYGTGYGTGKVTPTRSVIYVNSTATGGPSSVTSLVVVGPTTSAAGGGETSFGQSPSQTASVQKNGGAVKAIGGASALVTIGLLMMML